MVGSIVAYRTFSESYDESMKKLEKKLNQKLSSKLEKIGNQIHLYEL